MHVAGLRTELGHHIITIQRYRIPALNIPQYVVLLSSVVSGKFLSRSNAESYNLNETTLVNQIPQKNNFFYAK